MGRCWAGDQVAEVEGPSRHAADVIFKLILIGTGDKVIMNRGGAARSAKQRAHCCGTVLGVWVIQG